MVPLAARFPHLKAYLSSSSRPGDALDFEQLLGFLYAVSSAPDDVEITEWMQFVFVDGLPSREADDDAERIVAELFSLYHAIDRQVLEARVELPQECTPRSDALANLDPQCGLSRWSQGFSVGHDWLEEVWDHSVGDEPDEDLDWQLGGCMAVLCFFASREVAQALHEEFCTNAQSLEDRASMMLALFPEALNAYADIGRRLAADVHDFERIGRQRSSMQSYDPCPCGSGRSFRLCCGCSRCLH